MNEREFKALMSNFGTKIFHAVDPETAEFASSHCGKQREQFISYNSQGGEQGMTGGGGGSISEHYEASLKAKDLLMGLRTGGDANGKIVDGIVIRNALFSTHENFIKISFDQR